MMSLDQIMASAQQANFDRTRPGAMGALTDSQLEAYFGGQGDIQAARQADPNFNLAQWYDTFGKNEVMSGARQLSQPVGNVYATAGGDTAFTSGLNAFDEQQYLAGNQDVAQALQGGQFKSGLQHFLTYGQKEGRDPNARLGFLSKAASANPGNAGLYDPGNAMYAPTAGLFEPNAFDAMQAGKSSLGGRGFDMMNMGSARQMGAFSQNPFMPQTFMGGWQGGWSSTDNLSQVLEALRGGGGFGPQSMAMPNMASYGPSTQNPFSPQGVPGMQVGAGFNPLGASSAVSQARGLV